MALELVPLTKLSSITTTCLSSITSRIGLEKFGEAGTAFDPQIHDALMHETSPDVSVPTASKILQSGYKFKERILRPASVAVTDPAGE